MSRFSLWRACGGKGNHLTTGLSGGINASRGSGRHHGRVHVLGNRIGAGAIGAGHQPVMVRASLTADVKPVQAAKPGRQIVKFDGYSVSVPASWPVYDLTKDPRRCVRYDVHAVYLGTPGPDQNCPANLVGRVETVSIEGPAVQAREKIAGDRKAPARTGQRALTPGTIVQDPGPARAGDRHAGHLAADRRHLRGRPGHHRADAGHRPAGRDPGHGPAGHAQQAPSGDSIRVARHPVIVEAANLAQATNPAWPKVTGPPTGIPPGWLPPDWIPPGRTATARQPPPPSPPPSPLRPLEPTPRAHSEPARSPPPTQPTRHSRPTPRPTGPRPRRRPGPVPSRRPRPRRRRGRRPVRAGHGHGRLRHLRGPVAADHEGVAG